MEKPPADAEPREYEFEIETTEGGENVYMTSSSIQTLYPPIALLGF